MPRAARYVNSVKLKRSNPVVKPSANTAGSFDSAQDDLPVSSTARLIAAVMLSGRASSLPAISNAVP
jgi:hypothetical protein